MVRPYFLWAYNAVEKIATVIKPPPQLRVLNPTVIDIDTDVAYINIGLAEGIRNGNKFGVWDRRRELRDPMTGEVLGQVKPRRVDVIQVEQVLAEHLS